MAQDHPLPAPETLLEHAQWVSRLARDLVRDHQAAEDVVQETWLAFLRLRPDRNRPVRPWLARVVRNQAALLRRRGRGREAREAEVARPEAILSAEEVVERGEVQRQLVGAVLALDEPYRSTLLLRYYEGLAPREIAELRGIPAATVRTHLARGHARLKEALDGGHGGDRERWVRALMPLLPLGGAREAGPGVLAAAAGVLVVAGAVGLSLSSGGPDPGGDGGAEARTAPRARAAQSFLRPPGSDAERVAVGAAAVDATRRVTWLDAATDRPLAYLAVSFEGAPRVAGADGTLALPRGATSVLVEPEPGAAVWVVEGHGARVRRDATPTTLELDAEHPDRIAWPAGPTVRVRFAGPLRPDPRTLAARLGPVNLGPYTDHGEPIHGADLRTEPLGDFGVHDAWVRFGPEAASLVSAGAPLELEVRDGEGLARGTARVSAETLRRGAPVDVELAPTARLDLSVRLAAGGGADALEGAIFALQRPDGAVVAHQGARADGTATLAWVPPGEYALVLDAPRARADTVALGLDAGERAWREVTLVALEFGGRVSGRVLAAGADFDEQLLVFLRDDAGSVRGVAPTTWRSVDGERYAPFTFDQAPTGPLFLDVVSLASAVSARVEPAQLEAPCDTVVVRLADDAPSADVVVRAEDAGGAEIDTFRFEVSIDGGPTRRYDRSPGEGGGARWTSVLGGMRWNDFGGAAPLRRLPAGATLRWTLTAPGRAPVSGTEAELGRTADGAQELRVLAGSPPPGGGGG